MWLAGAGVKGGQALGATDELGFNAVSDRCHLRQDWDRISRGLADLVISQGWWPENGSKVDFAGSLAVGAQLSQKEAGQGIVGGVGSETISTELVKQIVLFVHTAQVSAEAEGQPVPAPGQAHIVGQGPCAARPPGSRVAADAEEARDGDAFDRFVSRRLPDIHAKIVDVGNARRNKTPVMLSMEIQANIIEHGGAENVSLLQQTVLHEKVHTIYIDDGEVRIPGGRCVEFVGVVAACQAVFLAERVVGAHDRLVERLLDRLSVEDAPITGAGRQVFGHAERGRVEAA